MRKARHSSGSVPDRQQIGRPRAHRAERRTPGSMPAGPWRGTRESRRGCSRTARSDTARNRGGCRRAHSGATRSRTIDSVCAAAGQDRRGVQPFDLCGCARVQRASLPTYAGLSGSSRAQLLRDVARHHQPFGVAIDDVFARGRQLGGARHEVDVDPGVHRSPRAWAASSTVASGSKFGRLPRSSAARGSGRQLVRVAAPAHLDQQRVEAVLVRGTDECGDAAGR